MTDEPEFLAAEAPPTDRSTPPPATATATAHATLPGRAGIGHP
jgi:hypothetical protein